MEPRQTANPAEWNGGPSDWKEHPLPRERTTLALDQSYSEEEMASIRLGSIPQQMEDKWFLYFADDRLFFLRSWTGYCVYVAHFRPAEKGTTLANAEVNRDPDQYTETDDSLDARMIPFLIDALLLGRIGEPPTDPNQPLKTWGSVGRLMLGVHPDDDEPTIQVNIIEEE